MAIQLPLLRSFPRSSEANPADYPVRWLTIQCSTQGLRVILQSFYLVYLIRIAKFAEQ